MNRNKLFKELINACKRNKMSFTDKGIRHNPTISYFVPNNIGKLMLSDNVRVEFINYTATKDHDVTIEVYDIDKNGDYVIGTSRKLHKDMDSTNPLTANEVLDLIVKINNIYNK